MPLNKKQDVTLGSSGNNFYISFGEPDIGFTADGVFVDENTLHHGGMIFCCRH